ncbi:unnamed protein product [Peronospora destructor]|uniref:HTH psq-type domain-containing protein n=1 Tax=Peronospora destructor TaxID=86335 RepID=A0AAV0V978_9STRA|nr:unnamed protein product [Peronospora destructor]
MSSNTVSDRVWAQAVHSVVYRRLTLRQASQTFGLQQAALHRLVRQHTLQQFRQMPSTRSHSTSPTDSDDSRLSALTMASSNNNTESSNKHYVFPRLNSVALGHSSPSSVSLPAVTPLAVVVPPPVCELTPEINDEIVAVLREQFMPQQYDDYETSDGRYNRLEGYADADIADVARAIVGHNGRRALPPNFPSDNWLATFKHENGFVGVDDMIRCGGRTSSGNRSNVPSQRQQQSRNNSNYELELQKYELEKQQDHEDQAHWIQSRNYRQPATPSSPSPSQHSPIQRHVSYVWDDVNGKMDGASRVKPLQRLRFHPLQYQLRDNGSPDADRCGLAGGVAAANVGKNSLPSIISRSSEATSLSSSGSSSSLSPHAQSVSGVSFPVHKSPVGTTSTRAWDNVKAGNKTNDDDANVPAAATVSPPSDDSKTASRQSCVILRL